MDECVNAICPELDLFWDSNASEHITEAYAKAFEVIKAEVSQLLMFRMFDEKQTENI